jgi:hypothetical protein
VFQQDQARLMPAPVSFGGALSSLPSEQSVSFRETVYVLRNVAFIAPAIFSNPFTITVRATSLRVSARPRRSAA